MNRAITNVKFTVPCLVLLASAQLAGAWYDPGVQRWINRDPLGERGGVNLYRPMANNTVGNVDIDGRSWRTTTAPKGGVDFGSVICMNGKPVPYIPRSALLSPTQLEYLEELHPGFGKSYSCYMDCQKRHEQSHADDALAENPNICTGVRNGTFVMNDDPTALYGSELKAHKISKKCLQDCNKTCPGGYVDEGLRKEKEWEDKYVYE
jgi:hypothetical protein